MKEGRGRGGSEDVAVRQGSEGSYSDGDHGQRRAAGSRRGAICFCAVSLIRMNQLLLDQSRAREERDM